MERYERLLERPAEEVMGEVCARVVEGDSLRAVARDWGLPVARFMMWVTRDDERRGMYEGALRLRADELVHESLGDADPVNWRGISSRSRGCGTASGSDGGMVEE